MLVRASVRTLTVALGLALGGCASSSFNPYREYELTDPANPEVHLPVPPGRFEVALSGPGDPVAMQTLLADAVRSSGGGVVSRITEPSTDPKVTARWQVEQFSGNLRALLAELLPERHIVGDDRMQIEMLSTEVTLRASLLTSRVATTQAAEWTGTDVAGAPTDVSANVPGVGAFAAGKARSTDGRDVEVTVEHDPAKKTARIRVTVSGAALTGPIQLTFKLGGAPQTASLPAH